MTRLGVTDLRDGLSDALARVAYAKERLVVHRKGRDFAAVVPLEDLHLLEELEDLGLAAMADEARAASTETITLDEMKRRLGV